MRSYITNNDVEQVKNLVNTDVDWNWDIMRARANQSKATKVQKWLREMESLTKTQTVAKKTLQKPLTKPGKKKRAPKPKPFVSTEPNLTPAQLMRFYVRNDNVEQVKNLADTYTDEEWDWEGLTDLANESKATNVQTWLDDTIIVSE